MVGCVQIEKLSGPVTFLFENAILCQQIKAKNEMTKWWPFFYLHVLRFWYLLAVSQVGRHVYHDGFVTTGA